MKLWLKYFLFFLAIGLSVFLINLTPANNLAYYYSLIFTFQSIIIGFIVTSLSIIASSPFSKKLYTITSEKNNSKTLLHDLLQKIFITVIIFTVPLLFILLKVVIKDVNLIKPYFGIYDSIIFVFTLISVGLFIKLVYDFKHFVIQSVK